MKKQSINRKHNIPDADLYLACISRIQQAKKELNTFLDYGYDEDRLRGFYRRCEQFRELPDDDELLGDQMVLTEKKYDAARKLRSAIRSLMTRVEMKYHNRSGRYRKFGTAKMGDMTDAQLIFCGRRVIRVARQQLELLADTGINEDLLQRISQATSDFEQAVNHQQDRVAERDIGVENRIMKGNQLYEELIVLSNIGKDIWRDKDPQRYEFWCLYESNNEQKKKARNREKPFES